MKTLMACIALMVAAALASGAADTKQQFIRKVGTYQLAPKTMLVVSRDAAGALRYSFDRVCREPHGSAEVGYKSELTEPFLFYWDKFSQVLWLATATHIVAHTPKGVVLYENNPKVLERAPEVFRTEVRCVFKSR